MTTTKPYRLTNVEILFPQPLVEFYFDDAATLNAALLEEIAARRTIEPGDNRSNHKGWHSAYDLFTRPEPAQAELCRRIMMTVVEATRKLAPDAVRDDIQIRYDGWINVNPEAAYNAPHHHPRAFWSGTYYVRIPKQDGFGGAIEFLAAANALVGDRIAKAPMTRDSVVKRPEPGTLILFPGNVRHWVHPNTSSEERVTIAFNASFAKAGSGKRPS